ncbi:unnamed protein product [Tuber melanosporum]|uniref:(Perigord truffle) hypothetical protein n=1 Tax=Tuber melanosporum (strain Mel28) TaxID=656061 RepID=D5G651_TUBMM|nr:uncharacterized protein GSTUM_00001771001 [Tuber melanosporum]CAZ79994.1 unnamed protein product [Tuber melanosporum]
MDGVLNAACGIEGNAPFVLSTGLDRFYPYFVNRTHRPYAIPNTTGLHQTYFPTGDPSLERPIHYLLLWDILTGVEVHQRDVITV